jgi:F-type H+-transporting ATPase subunit delta
MIRGSIVRGYAKALFDLASDQNGVAEISAKFGEVEVLLGESPQLQDVLGKPIYLAAERLSLAREVFSRMDLPPILLNFLLVLVENNRFLYVSAIYKMFQQLYDEQAGIRRGTLLSVKPIPDDDERKLVDWLNHRLQGSIQLEKRLDPNLLGGLKIVVGSRVIDASIRNQLERLKTQLKRNIAL